MKIFLIARSNMRKNRTASITLVILLMIATTMLYIGNSVIFQMNHFIDEKDKEINGAGFVLKSPVESEADVLQILQGMNGVSDIETQDVINYNWIPVKNLTKESEAKSLSILMINAEDEVKYCKLNMTVCESEREPKENSIILPYYLNISDHYEIGDQIELEIQGEKLEFEVYGFQEDTIFANPTNAGQVKCFVYGDKFKELYSADQGRMNQKFFKVKLNKGISTIDFEEDFIKRANESKQFEDGTLIEYNYDKMKEAAGLTLNLFMVMMIVFAAIIVIVTVVIIRFTIVTHIEENIKSLGSMQAMGYTNREIKTSLLVQFLSIGVIGYLLGMIISLLGRNVVNNLVSVTTGLMWENRIHIGSAAISFIVIMLMTALITLQTARKINSLNPITALRNGITTHNFEKNSLPIEDSHLPLDLNIGLKSCFHNKKQNISISIISLLITFTFVFTLTLYHNFIQHDKIMDSMIGLEQNVQVSCMSPDRKEIFNEISSMPGINRTVLLEDIDCTVLYQGKQSSTIANICNDYEGLEINCIYKGRYPAHDNEIVISSVVSKTLGAGIGDAVSIVYGDQTYDYLVVGLSQHVYQLGSSVSLTTDGMLRMNPDYYGSTLLLYQKEDITHSDLINTIQNQFTGRGVTCQDKGKMVNEMTVSIKNAILLIITVFVVVTIAVISITMHFLVKVKVIKEKTIIGIHKSLGFTAKQLLGHIVISFCPVVLLGSLSGGLLGVLFMNSIFSWMFSFTGISEASLMIPFQLIIIAVLAIALLAIVTTVISSLRIRKIQPCELFRA